MNRRAQARLWLAIGLGVGFVATRLTAEVGPPVHEIVGILWVAGLIVHLTWHGEWFRGLWRRLRHGPAGTRPVPLLVNALLLLGVPLIAGSGLLVAMSAGPAAALWQWRHHLLGELSIALVALHVGLHWKWFVHAGKQVLARKATD